jgi:uncharacterized protein
MIWQNHILIPALTAWALAQVIKIPLDYLVTHRWNWNLLRSPGGMPSSHSALVIGILVSSGLYAGFDSSSFAIAAALAMVVIYDATGIRRQAGMHAQRINTIIRTFLEGQPISQADLKEVLGHTPRQVMVGSVMGLTSSLLFWFFWR